MAGANRWRDREADLPADATRDVHYPAIPQPLDPTEFVAELCAGSARR